MTCFGASTFVFGVPGGSATVTVAAVVTLVLAALALGERGSTAPSRVALSLVLLRLLGLVLAFLVVVQPSWLHERIERRPGRLAILVDTSRSMTAPSGDDPRLVRVRELLARWSTESGFPRASLLRFDAHVAPTSVEALSARETYDGESSALRDALSSLVSEEGSEDLGAVVVVSDGAASGQRDEPFGNLGGVRVHAVAIGDRPPRGDRSIAEVAADARAFLRQPYVVRVKLRARDRAGGTLPLSLYRGDERLATRDVPLDATGEGEARFEVDPVRVGTVFHRLALDEDPRDPIPENDSRAFLVDVTRDRLRVLHVAGHPSWDVRFLRQFLKRDASVDLVSFFILRTNTDMTLAPTSELALIPFPTDELFREHLASFDVVVFQNFEFRPFHMAQYLPAIARYVENGGAFAMIGGDSSFASGEYEGTPIEDTLPVRLPAGRGRSAVLEAAFSPLLVPETDRHPVVALVADRAANHALFAGLAPLLGINVLAGPREGARVLLAHPTARGEGGVAMPLLAVSERGRGRVLAFASDASYRWGITSGGTTGDASVFERFWDRSIRWLARDPALDASDVSLARRNVGPRADLVVDVLARDDAYAPLTGRPLVLEARDASDAVVARTTVQVDDEGRGRANLRGPGAPGAYRVLLVDGETLRAEDGFVVETGGDELADPVPDPAYLERLAREGHGRFVADARNAPALAELDTTRERSLGVVPYAPFASPLALVLLVLLFGGEWLLRRRHGLS